MLEVQYGVDLWVQCTTKGCESTNGKIATDRRQAIDSWNRRPEIPLILSFPPTPRAVVIHEQLGELFDRLSLHFYAAKHAEALAKLLEAAYIIELKPLSAPAHPAMKGISDGK